MKDAITRAKSELGGVKSADNLVSPEEMAALRRDPVPSSGPAVWRRPGETGGGSSVPPASGGQVPPRPTAPGVTVDQLRTPANGTASMNIDSAKRAAAANAAKRAPAPKSAETPAPKSAETPADDLAKQIRPGTDTPKTPSGRQDPGMDPPASGENKFSIDDVERLFKAGQPAAAQAAAKEAGIDLSKPGIFRRNPLKTGIGVAIPDLYNQLSPSTAPKLPYTPGEAVIDLGKYFGKNFMANQNIPGIKSVTPVVNNQSNQKNPPTDAEIQQRVDNDPDMQALNKKRADAGLPPLEESTNELNRLVFLSRP